MEIIFNKPLALLLFFIIPVIIILHYYFFQHNKKKAMKFSNFSAMKRVTGTKLITKNTSQLILRITLLSFLILAFSQPVIWYNSDVSITDYVIAIDSSASMTSQDVLPNRLQVSKQAASSFISKLDGKTSIGVISFSGVSFVKSPMTEDISKIQNAISDIDIELSGGTDIGSAMITSANLLMPSSKTKAIILITDGSDTAGVFVDESIETALNYVVSNNIIVHTISIGSGISNAGYLQDIGLPALYERESLKLISERTGGSYYEVKSTAEIASAFLDLNNKTEEGKAKFEIYDLLFVLSFVLILIEWILLNTRFRSIP
jgi:Ca-activated chloride channel family protein